MALATLPPVPAPITHPRLTRVGGELVVTWRGGGDVTVFVATDPDDAGVDARAPDRPGMAVIGPAPHRTYVHLLDPEHGFVVVGERRVLLDGAENFRDLGGYQTDAGRWVRWGRVFRSDGLHRLSDHDHRRLEQLGVDLVFDVRSDAEVESAPDRLPGGIERVHRPLSSDHVATPRPMIERIRAGDVTHYDLEVMHAAYLRLLERAGPTFAEVIEAVASGRRVVVHCSAGKDRTGLASMLLLGLVGVGTSMLLDDYEITDHYRDSSVPVDFQAQLRELDLDPAEFAVLFRSPRALMRRTLDTIAERWGSIEAYVAAAGVTQPTVAALRGVLTGLHPPPQPHHQA